MKTSPEANSFKLSLTKFHEKSVNKLKVCASYTGTKEHTNMVVIEIELLSGFELTPKSLEQLENNKEIKKVEYDEETYDLALYFNEMKKEETCFKFEEKEVIKVEDRKPALAKIYDYYYQKDIVSIEYH